MKKKNSFNGLFKATVDKFIDNFNMKDTKVLSTILAVIMLVTSFGFVTKYYTLGYNVYYGDVNVGVSETKQDAINAYDEAKSDVKKYAKDSLRYELDFTMTVAPISKIVNSDIYRGIVEAAQGLEDCYSISVNGTSVVKVKTAQDAEFALASFLAEFNAADAVIATGYTIAPDKDIVTEIVTSEKAVEKIKESGLFTVTYSSMAEEIEVPFNETIVEDASIMEGCVVCTQEGVCGKSIKKTVTTYENGVFTTEDVTVEVVLAPVDKIVCVGTGKMDGIAPKTLPWPATGTFTSEFGRRWGRNHNGIDIAAPTGTPIYAPCGGTVIFSGQKNGYGNYIMIDHGEGYVTTYAHMNQRYVEEGQLVNTGDLIGEVGTTGRVTGAHLHFEILLNDSFVDPMNYIAG